MRFLTESRIWAKLTAIGFLLVVDDGDVLLQGGLGAALKVEKKLNVT